MVMQDVFELLKSHLPFPLFPFSFIFSRRQVTLSYSYLLVLFFCHIPYYEMCFSYKIGVYLSIHDVKDFLCRVLSCYGFPTGNTLFRIFFFFSICWLL